MTDAVWRSPCCGLTDEIIVAEPAREAEIESENSKMFGFYSADKTAQTSPLHFADSEGLKLFSCTVSTDTNK